jgi:beta-lactamase superfamily II metal-dependent hydrolase
VLDNSFLIPGFRGDFERSKRVYMRLDHEENNELTFDAVSADFFDELPEIHGVAGWSEFSRKAPIFIIEIRRSRFRHLLRGSSWSWPIVRYLRSLAHQYPPFVLVGRRYHSRGTLWFEAFLDWTDQQDRIYHNLFQEAAPVALKKARYLEPEEAARLDAAFTLDGLAQGESPIKAQLSRIKGAIDWVSVFDVGQGNANALCDHNETPLLYYDLGGGVQKHATSFPSGLTDFCYAADPAVILSHWDWDHWSSGARFPSASLRKWIVPNQWLGGVHATFAASLHGAGNLLVWPTHTTMISSGQVTIRKCTARGKARNHTGLAVEVTGPSGEAPILLPGDARYSAIPGAVGRNYTSIVASHHGADMGSNLLPIGRSLPGARTVYSFGAGNKFKHPTSIAKTRFNGAGWPQPAIARETCALRPRLGHVGLSWTAGAPLPGHRCAQPGCAVSLRQT